MKELRLSARINQVCGLWARLQSLNLTLDRSARRERDWQRRDAKERRLAKSVQLVARLDAHIGLLQARLSDVRRERWDREGKDVCGRKVA